VARNPRSGPKSIGRSGLPTKDAILDFIKSASEGKSQARQLGKREIARAFSVKGGDRVALKQLLAEMTEDGLLSGNRKGFQQPGALPPVAVLEVVARDAEGELAAEVAGGEIGPDGRRERVLVLPWRGARKAEPALGEGDRILARLTRLKEPDAAGYRYEAEPIKRLPKEKRRQLGIFRARDKGGGVIDPVDRKEMKEWPIAPGDEGEARDGDLVRFDLARKGGRYGVPQARVVESLGNPQDQRKISLIAVHAHGLRDEFPSGVLAETERLRAATPAGRTDLRALPLVTIDPVDARDHDDAVHAAPDADPANKGGWVVHIAIADVAHYVHAGSRLDREARLRGNSVYFPDRVVPMLPERISNDLCSLREGEERPCLAVRLVIDRHGHKKGQTLLRGTMRSAAKLAYEEAQAAIDGKPSGKCKPLLDTALKPLWGAYAALAEARDRREPLDLDLPERKVLLNTAGRVERVVVPCRLTAHRLVEEFMIQANVAVAEMLEARRAPVIYRVHDAPSKEKIVSLREFLDSLDLRLPSGGGTLRAGDFNKLLLRARALPVADLINEVVLRSQSQAVYAAENIGHFGLHLARYAHFTSPIRRYADLIVHRSLIRTLGLGTGGLTDTEAGELKDIAQEISDAERRAMSAERETVDRLIAGYLAERVGAEFGARISGTTRAGLFVRLDDTGADGFVPAATLNDYYRHDEAAHTLVGDRTGHVYRLGDSVRVRLVEAVPSAGALRFEMLSPGTPGGRGREGRSGGRRRFMRRRAASR
jgi:ribonuclease R